MNLLHANLRQVVFILFLICGWVFIQPIEVKAVTGALLSEPIPLPQEAVPQLPDLEVEEPHKVIEPVKDRIEEEISTVHTDIEEVVEPIEQAELLKSVEPILHVERIKEAVNVVAQQPALVDETTVVKVTDSIGDGVKVIPTIPTVDDLVVVPTTEPFSNQRVIVELNHDDSGTRNDRPPIPVQRQIPNKPLALAIQYGNSTSTGASGSDYSAGSASSLIAGIRDSEYMLTRTIIVTRNYANEFILYNQWSHAPPGQPPKQILLNLIMD